MKKTLLSVLICSMALSACNKDRPKHNGTSNVPQSPSGAEILINKETPKLQIERVVIGKQEDNSAPVQPKSEAGNSEASAIDAYVARAADRHPIEGRANVRTVKLYEADGNVPGYGRGFYTYGKDPSKLTDWDVENAYRAGYRLMYMPADLSQWRNQDLPQSYLNALDKGLSKMRHVNAILRFAYDYNASGKDTNLEQVKRHIKQLRPILAKNRDNIFVWQAGFIGAWGEWHSSANGLDSNANKAAVYKALLEANYGVNGIYAKLQLRYPNDLINFQNNRSLPYGVYDTGLHNDCFMAGTDDVGTYHPRDGRSPAQLRQFARNLSKTKIFGGETCDPTQGARQHCSQILKEGPEYHLTYLNKDFSKAFIGTWEREGCFNEVAKRMGYRYVVDKASLTTSAAANGTVQWAVTISNKGWANAPDWGYKLYLGIGGKKVLLERKFEVQPGQTKIFTGSFKNLSYNSGRKAPILLIDTEDANYAGPHTLQFANKDDANAQKVSDPQFGNGLMLKGLSFSTR